MKDNLLEALELLLLNDLLDNDTIDKDIYNKAVERITTLGNNQIPRVKATATV